VMLTLEAVFRGLRPLLLEKNDFGGATSFNSLRIVHGGLRYLQTLNLSRARRSIRARRELMRIAPGIINPIECRIPMTKWGGRSRLPITAAWVFSDILGWDRNVGLCAEQRLPPNRFWANKNMRPAGPGGSAVPAAGWWDAIVMRPHRLTSELVQRNVSQGVRVTDHARV
jgi:glycerol-3-phosphate dehydrogenase